MSKLGDLAIASVYGLETAAFLTVGPVYEEPSKPFYVTTYSPDWVRRYIEKDFFDIDPVLHHGLRAVTLVDWKEIDLSDKAVRTSLVKRGNMVSGSMASRSRLGVSRRPRRDEQRERSGVAGVSQI
ncbi:autoinducer binding domain-containing protein [Mesorhizobium sp. M1312]|uniref:autoinducer binding domain-containing protein n=1 Tax=unclassified Mesorhizobium TaxID=325217 RepID=UPI003336C172